MSAHESKLEAAMAALNGDVIPEPLQEEGVQDGLQQEEPPQTKETQTEKVAEKPESITALYARLSERDRELVELRNKVKSFESAPKAPDWDSLRQQVKEDPIGIIDKLGLDFTQLFGDPQEQQKQQDPNALYEKTIEELRNELKQHQQQTNQYLQQQAQQQQMERIDAHIQANSDKYPFLNAVKDNGGVAQAYELMVQLYQETQRVPAYDDFLGQLEEHVSSLSQQYYDLYSNIKAPKKPPQAAQSAQTPQPGITETPSPTPLTAEERLKRALAKL